MKDKIGFYILIVTIVLFFLLKLPFNLSVECSSHNEGFYFVYGHYLFNGDLGMASRGPLFIFVYSMLLKIFGFSAFAVIAVHFIQTFISILIGILIYLISTIILESSFYAAFASLLWFFLLITPIGGWGGGLELDSIFALEAEYFCVLLSLLSIYCLIKSFQIPNEGKALAFCAGLLSGFSAMFKMSGIVLLIAYLLWTVLTKEKRKHLWFLFLGIVFSLLIYFVSIYTFFGNSALSLDSSLYGKSYSTKFIHSFTDFAIAIINFMFRYETSFSGFNNFILTFIMFLGIMWSLKRSKNCNVLIGSFWILIAIWSLGNVGAVMAPGDYAAYYYLLLWPSLSIYFALATKYIFSFPSNPKFKILKIATLIFLFLGCLQRIFVTFPNFLGKAEYKFYTNAFSQKQSFEDPVLPYDLKVHYRPTALKLGDLLNSLLPDKSDTFYVVNFVERHYTFSSNLYVYAKRFPPTTVISDKLHYSSHLNQNIEKLKQDFEKTPPKVIVLPKTMHIRIVQMPYLKSFFEWLDVYAKQYYNLASEINFPLADMTNETIEILIRKG